MSHRARAGGATNASTLVGPFNREHTEGVRRTVAAYRLTPTSDGRPHDLIASSDRPAARAPILIAAADKRIEIASLTPSGMGSKIRLFIESGALS
ncbi:hypothetical protein [Burkholderia vietnamiensis]|uniref:hypothetical protein n=1 Tax=Burkholderia vietnamiensis TaxID=60552 RepID=UPI0012D90175|nr:hypothetical protein [Burkholderia vietnamiensis]MDN7927569.1 hypothetical protein [Burkholderia vietnamiensis]